MSKYATRDIQTVLRERVVPAGGSRHGLVVGIESYRDSRLNLRCARADAQAIYDVMIDPECGMFPKENVRLLLDAEATKENIWRTLAGLRRSCGQDDTVWIYYAGHGAPEESHFYWVTHDADVDDLYGTGLSNDQIAKVFDDIRARQLVVLLDCCHAAATSMQKNPTRAVLTAEEVFASYQGKGRITISSSEGTEKSVELGDVGHGAFTYFLQKGLRGEADRDGDGVVGAEELWSYLRRQVADASQKAGNRQTPVLRGQMTHELALTLNPVASQRKSRIVESIEGLVGLGADRLTTDEASWCLELLRRGPEGPQEQIVSGELEKLADGQADIAVFKMLVQLAFSSAGPPQSETVAKRPSPEPGAPRVTIEEIVPLRTRAEAVWESVEHLSREPALKAGCEEIRMVWRNAETFFEQKVYGAAKSAYEDLVARCVALEVVDARGQAALAAEQDTQRAQQSTVAQGDTIGLGQGVQNEPEQERPAASGAPNRQDDKQADGDALRPAVVDVRENEPRRETDDDTRPPLETPWEDMSPQQKHEHALHALDFRGAQKLLSEHRGAMWVGHARDDWRAAVGNEISRRADQVCEHLRKRRVYRAQKIWEKLRELITLAPDVATQHSAEISHVAETVIWGACRGLELASLETMAIACTKTPAVDAKVRQDLATLRPRLRNIIATLDELNRKAPSKKTLGWLHKMGVRRKVRQLEEEYQLPKNWVRESLVSQVDRWINLLQLLYPDAYPKNEYGLELKRGLLLMNEDKHVESAEHFLRAIQLEPDSAAIAHNNYAWLFVVSDDPRFSNLDEAIQHAKRAVELVPRPFILDTLAEVQRKAGNLDDAIATMQLAVEKETDPANAADWSEKIQEFRAEKGCGDSEAAIDAIRNRRSTR